jgi:hypothetical protein
MHVFVSDRGRVGGELADDFLEDVLECHEALDVAVFIDHEGQAAAVALERVQLRGQRRAFRHEIRLARACQLHQALACQRVAGQFLRHAFHVDDADEVVEFAVVQRQPRVWCLAQLVEDVFPVVLDVDRGDLLPRHHDVVHRDVLEIEDGQQHLAVTRRDHRSRLGDHGAQFLGRHRATVRTHRFHAEDTQESVRRLVSEPGDGRGDEYQHFINVGGRQRHRVGLERCIDLGREFAEHDHEHRQHRHGDRDGMFEMRALR